MTTIHHEVGAGIVRCGEPMRSPRHPEGWTLESSSVDRRDVTCPLCLEGGRAYVRAVREGRGR